jgi:predicted Zn-ribbon and HTH transcriptional regulator
MSTIHTNITTDRECDHCGYNLKGLPMGSKCPECGTPVRRLSSKTSGTIMDEAPTRFVRKLRLGFLLATASIILTILFPLFGPDSAIPEIFFSLLWLLGIFIFTQRRPKVAGMRADKILDNDKFRLIVRAANITWPIRALCLAALEALNATQTGGSPLLVGFVEIMVMIFAIASWISMIPTSIYVAELAYWSAHNNLADRMRGCAWILAVIGTLASAMTGVGMVLNWPLLVGLTFIPWLIILVTVLVYNLTFFQMTHVMHWVIKNQVHAAGSFERMEERRKKEEQYRGRIVDDTPCDRCGYNIIGLEPGSPCPECGTLVSHPTRPEIRDPAKTRSYHDNSPIDVEGYEGEINHDSARGPDAAGVPYSPQTEVPDEGDIPLSMDDDPEHPKSIRHENRDHEHKIKPISFDDER